MNARRIRNVSFGTAPPVGLMDVASSDFSYYDCRYNIYRKDLFIVFSMPTNLRLQISPVSIAACLSSADG
jgi:hypothetical protein